jgi:hypothetical protein
MRLVNLVISFCTFLCGNFDCGVIVTKFLCCFFCVCVLIPPEVTLERECQGTQVGMNICVTSYLSI